MHANNQQSVWIIGLSLCWVAWSASANDAAESKPAEQAVVFQVEDDLDLDDPEIGDQADQVDFEFEFADWMMQPPAIAPVRPPSEEAGITAPRAAAEFEQIVFASENLRRSQIADYRARSVSPVGTELVFGSEGRFRVTTDSGDLLGKSMNAPSVRVQRRTPAVSEPRIRGSRGGRLLASGSYWAPARDDLDTALSKIDSQTIRDIIVIKGPYTALLGPGFYFIDFEFAPTPRSCCGYEWSGSNALEYQSNGQQFFGRQTVQGGGENYGYRINYGHRTGNDYETGDGWSLPTSYNSRYLDVAFGYDFSPNSRLEFNYLRVDQTGVEFPGMVFDINWLGTDGYELRYILEDQPEFDLLTIDGWYNRTEFTGDTSRTGKNRQIPSLRSEFGLGPDQFLTTDVDGMSAGYRLAVTWGQRDDANLTIGTDLIRVGQQLNDIVPEHDVVLPLPPPFPPLVSTFPERNYPIPRSRSIDVGLFVEHEKPLGDSVQFRTGARVDLVNTNARDDVPGMGVLDSAFPNPNLIELPLSILKASQLENNFVPWSVFATADYEINPCWTASAGAGYAMRTPTLTELYAAGPFIGSLQPGLTFVEGDPQLDPERLLQIDIGLRADLGGTRMSASGFYAWIFDYITYDDVGAQYQPPLPTFEPGVDLQQVAYVNTDRATLVGFELVGEQDLTTWLTGFGVMSYVEGRDHTRLKPSRIASIIRERNELDPNAPRSFNGTVDSEPLPGIPPLEARVGLRVKEPYCERWAVEVEARIVDNQERVAATLFERPTPGFTVWNVRGYWRPYERMTLYGGVENVGDIFYREHLDYRPGLSVWQPGISFYMMAEVSY
ncbi:MAG: TonB-dependent receptor [Pirellulaceae bacterium]|nr:TonB-dependent receptor [Pirellulaceae bacterium]